MATMGFQPYDMNGVHVVHLPALASSGTFVKGDVVYLNSGLVTITASNGMHFGVAAADNDVASATVPVYLVDPASVWVGTVSGTSAASTVGENYGITYTKGSMCIDQTDTITTVVRVVGLHPADGGKALGRVLFCWCSGKYLQGDVEGA